MSPSDWRPLRVSKRYKDNFDKIRWEDRIPVKDLYCKLIFTKEELEATIEGTNARYRLVKKEVTMKIRETEPITCMSIKTDKSIYCDYLRFSSDSWYIWMGESLEPHYNCKEIEALYQRWIRGE